MVATVRTTSTTIMFRVILPPACTFPASRVNPALLSLRFTPGLLCSIITAMISVTTAKVLLFIGLTLGPANPTAVFCTSHNESYNWTPEPYGWRSNALGFPASDFSRDPSKIAMFAGSPHKGDVPPYIGEIADHDWSQDSVVILSNGDRVEKKGDHAYYIVNPGAPNEKDFTISYETKN
jgi:hypothetical protein